MALLYQASEWVAMKAPGLVTVVAAALAGAATAYVLLSFS